MRTFIRFPSFPQHSATFLELALSVVHAETFGSRTFSMKPLADQLLDLAHNGVAFARSCSIVAGSA